MEKFTLINRSAKMAFYLLLSDIIIEMLNDSDKYIVTKEYLNLCWQWINEKNVEADELYSYLESEKELCVLNFMSSETNVQRIKAWSCLCYVVGHIALEAYKFEGAKFVPQTLECPEDEIIEDFLENFKQLYQNSDLADRLLEYLAEHYPASNDNEVDIESLRRLVNELNIISPCCDNIAISTKHDNLAT